MLGFLAWALIGFLAGVAIYEITVTVINKISALNALKKVKADNSLTNAIKGVLKSKEAKHVTLDMLDKYGKKLAEVKINGEQVSSDIAKGMILDLV